MDADDDELTPLARDRCFTWPLAPPDPLLVHQTHTDPTPQSTIQQQIIQPSTSHETSQSPQLHGSDGSGLNQQQQADNAALAYRGQFYGDTSIPPTSSSTSSKKPNPWGEQSYADLITQALYSSQTGRLKLNEVYQWFSDNVPFFSERSSTEAASGWKNSIRHNLSLHSRFMRVTNEGAGKSSWWVLNPDAKPGKSTRRRAHTMEAGQRPTMERKRQRAKRKVENGVAADGSTGDVMISPHGEEETQAFRGRSNSTLSNYSTPASRISPPSDGSHPPTSGGFTIDPSSYWSLTPQGVEGGLVDLTDNMRLAGTQMMPTYRNHPYLLNSNHAQTFGTPPNPASTTQTSLMTAPIKSEPLTKLSDIVPSFKPDTDVVRPPTYNDLYPRFGATGTLLRETLQRGLPAVSSANGLLPFDIATIDCANWQQMDIDTQAVIQHEMRYDGKLDFTGLERM